MLYIVPTPVGNLDDITVRASKVLSQVDLILAEDTRTSSVLLKHLGISKPMTSFHKFNEHQVLNRIIERLSIGEEMALISDAGTPGISDPGYLIIRECIENNIDVICLPGATAFIPALVSSGLPCDRFVFEGFLPVKKGRQTRLKELAEETRTIVIYESPHRLKSSLEDLKTYFGAERKVVISREISKKFEEHKRGTLGELCEFYTANQIKGELVITIEGLSKKKHRVTEEIE